MLIWVGWPNSEEVGKFDLERERKSKQVHARPGQTESLVNPSVQLAVPLGTGEDNQRFFSGRCLLMRDRRLRI